MAGFDTLRGLKGAIEQVFEYSLQMSRGDPESEEAIEGAYGDVMEAVRNSDAGLLAERRDELMEAFEFYAKAGSGDTESMRWVERTYGAVGDAVADILGPSPRVP